MVMTGKGKAPLARKMLRDDVYDMLLDMLVDEQLAPGDPVVIERVAADLGISPTPVREALVHLEHTGLVTRTALKGYRVAAPLSVEALQELIEARKVVELAAVEQAIARASEILEGLEAAHRRHARAIEDVTALRNRTEEPLGSAEMREYFAADWGFHVEIMRGSGNRYLLRMLEGLGAHVHRFRQYGGHGVSDAEFALSEHQAVLDAFRAGDAAAAIEAMRIHIENVKARASEDQLINESQDS